MALKAFGKVWFSKGKAPVPAPGHSVPVNGEFPLVTIEELRAIQSSGKDVAIVSGTGEYRMLDDIPPGVATNMMMVGTGILPGGPIMRRDVESFSVSSRATDLIAGTIADMPWMYGVKNGRHYERQEDLVLENLFNKHCNFIVDAPQMWENVVRDLLYQNESFIHVLKNSNGFPVKMTRLEPSQIQTKKMRGFDALEYQVTMEGGRETLTHDQIIHVLGPGNTGLDTGRSVAQRAGNAIKLGLEVERHTNDLFAGGSLQNFALYSEDPDVELDDKNLTDIATSIKKRVDSRLHGRTPLWIPAGIKIMHLSITPQDAQLQEMLHYAKQNCATFYGMPNGKVNEEMSTTWGKNIAETGIAFDRDTLADWIRRIESAVNRNLFWRTNQEMRMDRTNYTRDTFVERLQALVKALGGNEIPGGISTNEFRVEMGFPRGGPELDVIYEPTRREARDARAIGDGGLPDAA